MKTIRLYAAIVFAAVALSSCNEDYGDAKMHTTINSDGTCSRSIDFKTESIDLKTEYEVIPSGIDLGSDWTSAPNDDTARVAYIRNFDNVEQMSQAMPLKLNKKPLSSKATFEKRFRWFYTEYTFTEVFATIGGNFPLPPTNYADAEEVNYWFTGQPNLINGMNGAEAMERRAVDIIVVFPQGQQLLPHPLPALRQGHFAAVHAQRGFQKRRLHLAAELLRLRVPGGAVMHRPQVGELPAQADGVQIEIRPAGHLVHQQHDRRVGSDALHRPQPASGAPGLPVVPGVHQHRVAGALSEEAAVHFVHDVLPAEVPDANGVIHSILSAAQILDQDAMGGLGGVVSLLAAVFHPLNGVGLSGGGVTQQDDLRLPQRDVSGAEIVLNQLAGGGAVGGRVPRLVKQADGLEGEGNLI